MKKAILMVMAVVAIDACIIAAEENAALKSDAGAKNQQMQIEIAGDGCKKTINVRTDFEGAEDLAGKGIWIPFIAGYRHGDFNKEWFIFPLLTSGSSSGKSDDSDFFSPLYSSISKGFCLTVDDSNKNEVVYDLLINDKTEDDNACIKLYSCPVLLSFCCFLKGKDEKLDIFSILPLLTMTAETSESYMLASVPLLTFYESEKETENCKTLFGLLFDYEKDVKTEETSIMKGILYSSDMDGVMDKRKIGPFGLLYSSTIKEGQKKYSSMWDFLFNYSSGGEKNKFEIGPFGLFYSHLGTEGQRENTSILYSFLYESNKSADGKTQSWSFTPLFGIKRENDELGFSVLSIDLL